jgi:NAD(P)-dependent dehydrogenase (short-subunit alcohol dehydrogenase family)
VKVFDLTGRRALVTGGGTGIGRALVMALAEAGATVVICGRRVEPLRATVAAAKSGAAAGAIHVVAADVTHEPDVQRLRDAAGDIDILVNNAGGAQQRPWLDVTSEHWRDVVGLNLDAAFRLSQVFAPAMTGRGWGRIINIASVYGMIAADPGRYPGMTVDNASYVAAKHGLIGMTRHLAVRLGRTGVTVNAISPGMIMVEKHAATLTDGAKEALAAGAPAGRMGTPEDLQTALLFLASPGSGFVTGQNVVVDGGWTIW